MPEQIQNLLDELKAGLRQIYGEQLKSVILYGSYARGDAHPPDSDIDVLIVLKGPFSRWEMVKRSSELVAALSLEHEVVISRTFASETEYTNSKMPLFINIRKEGLVYDYA
jgi:uncharacterized protein